MRPHQWLKNLLVFVALITSLSFAQVMPWVQATGAFVAFCLIASGIYIINDLLDLDADRSHPRKRARPFAAGCLPPQVGILASIVLVSLGMSVGALLPWPTMLWIIGYVALTLAYSIVLKARVLLDVMSLAGLYAIRVVTGAAAIQVVPSFWLLAFSVFVFFSLALVKRCAEIAAVAGRVQGTVPGRDYRVSDEPALRTLGVASGVAAIVVFALYISAPETVARLRSPEHLWPICPLLLYWIGRVWIKTTRGEMHDDPLVFTLRDRGSRLVLTAICLIFVATALW
jgi:4-hydroxybenzoate polyprenyltransferase